eukprot:4898435-Lingulodinium_polyedra.AAC.1
MGPWMLSPARQPRQRVTRGHCWLHRASMGRSTPRDLTAGPVRLRLRPLRQSIHLLGDRTGRPPTAAVEAA